MDRKKFFKQGLAKILDAAKVAATETAKFMSEIEEVPLKKLQAKKKAVKKTKTVFTRAKRPKKGLKYPPGAVENFLQKCTGCSDCVNACPHNSIIPVYNERLGKDIPQMDINMSPCRMCSDWPCIGSCKPKALKSLKKNEMPNFGKAIFTFDFCLNNEMENPICTACRDICPLGSISFKEKDIKFDRSCTGCGICVKGCPTFPRAILVK